jgi:Kef-type K+ transport system membrane component KefB/mannitol/fructose-specific phosphotransferase system IIA component (Ntr-type)
MDITNTAILDRMMILVLQLGVIIFAARAGGIVFEKIKLPPIIGEITAGIIIGPYLLGGISLPVLGQPLFVLHESFPISAELYAFTTVASIVLLFLVGLETDLEMFLRYSLAGSMVGLGGVIFSFILGDLTAVLFSKYIFGIQYSFSHPICLFLGVISTATSVGITARILSENRKMQSPEGVTIISAAVIDDILGIIALAIVIGVAKSGHVEWHKVGAIAFKSIAIWLGFTAAGLIFSSRISSFLKRFKDPSSITVMAFAMALLLAGIFEKAGLAMIVGAYIMGLSLSKTDLDYLIQDKLSSLHRFFVPIFFCVMGMFVDFSTMSSKIIIFFGVAYTLANILGKIIGCGLPASLLNFNARGALRIGLGMTPRGEVTLLIAGIGLSSGILGQDTLGTIVLMTLITALISPGMFSAALKSEKKVLRKQAPQKESRSSALFNMPTPETAELVVSKIISAFNNEGFYVHRLDTGDRISRLYQIRKERVFIGLKITQADIYFDAKNEELPFINTLVYEIFAELERTMRQLQSGTDKAAIGRKIFDKKSSTAVKKRDSLKIIHPNAIDADLKSSSKEQVIEELVGLLVSSGQLSAPEAPKALKDVQEREELMSTGMQFGIALPHAKTDAVKNIVCALGVSKKGIDFKSLDGKPAHIFILILSPKDITGPHIRLMADISQLLMDKAIRDKILKASTREDIYRVITST